MSEIVIQARGLQKSWRGQTVLDKVDLDLKRGSVCAVLGPSGTGKSTLLRVIAGLEPVESGKVSSSDNVLTDGKVKVQPEHRNTGLVFQDFSLFPHLTALDNVLFGLKDGSSASRREHAMAHLASVEMAGKEGAYPHTLSGGEQQRVALARALAPQPDVVLLDEAFSGLDAKLRVSLRDTALKALKESGAAVLVVTHDAEEAMFMADELALMVGGQIIQSGSPEQVYLKPNSLDAARLLGEVNSWTGPLEGRQLVSPFGIFNVDLPKGTDAATVLVRPEALCLTRRDQGAFRIVEAHPLGAHIAVRVEAPTGEIWRSRNPIGQPFEPGDMVEIDLDNKLVAII
ncbi:MAG: ABC transporter ATP-binding protein [Parasphingorhabdus sp.]